MDPQQLPLEPLIAPPAVSWWPLAPIWWITIAVILFAILAIIFYVYKKKKPNTMPEPIVKHAIDSFRKEALAELSTFEKPYQKPAGPWLQEINKLLKRICIARYPNENTKLLIGNDWLIFLSSKCPEANIQAYSLLVDKEYHPNYFLDNETIDHLYLSVEKWINHYV